MALLATFDIGAKTREQYIISSISENEKRLAMRKFNEMKANNSLRGEFEDDIWWINNETDEKMLDFTACEIYTVRTHHYSFKDFMEILKYYICLSFGDRTLVMYPRVISNIKNAILDTALFTILPKDISSLQKEGVEEFISLIPWISDEFFVSESGVQYDWFRRRTLAEYQSYFLFGEIMDNFWKNASEGEKDYFYPLYLWWNITMILPLRVTEFTVIPKDCLQKRNNRWYLTVRRTAIKGRQDVSKRYKVNTDYKKWTYEITEKLASDILDYEIRAKRSDMASIDSLFSDSMYIAAEDRYLKKGRSKTAYPHMRTIRFRTLLDRFYQDVIQKEGYLIRTKESLEQVDETGQEMPLNRYEIAYINLGDTRHIAMQNILLNDCNLLMAKEITGHETVDMIYSYSGNMRKIVKCHAYSLYKLSQRNAAAAIRCNNKAEVVLANVSQKYVDVDTGKCYSTRFVESADTSDCFKVGGECSICKYHKSGSENIIKERLERDFDEKIARLRIWIKSSNQLVDKEEIAVMAEGMAAAKENLEIAYYKELCERGRIDG